MAFPKETGPWPKAGNQFKKTPKSRMSIVPSQKSGMDMQNRETVDELAEAFRALEGDPEVKAVILTGMGEKAFIAGADIAELAGLDREAGQDYVRNGQELTKLMENYPKPVIAAINGFALGGGTEMALACHVRIASENAKLGQPEVKLGLIPGFGGTQRLPRLVGMGIAMEMILTGERIFAIKRVINNRLGITRADDTLPERLLTQARPSGQAEGELPDLAVMLDEYYATRGWLADGHPSPERLEKLGLVRE